MAPGTGSSICKEVLESQAADHELSIASDELEKFQLTMLTIAPSIKGGVSSTNGVNELLLAIDSSAKLTNKSPVALASDTFIGSASGFPMWGPSVHNDYWIGWLHRRS